MRVASQPRLLLLRLTIFYGQANAANMRVTRLWWYATDAVGGSIDYTTCSYSLVVPRKRAV